MNALHILLMVFVVSFGLSSCQNESLRTEIPAYLIVDSVDVQANYALHGSSSHRILDVWVYLNNRLIGAFPLPARVPLRLADGENKVRIAAGIALSGFVGQRAPYEPYTEIEFEVEEGIQPLDEIKIFPVFNYKETVQMPYREDFENTGLSLIPTAVSDAGMIRYTAASKVYEGNASGGMRLEGQQEFFEIKTVNSYFIPLGESGKFLEMNFKSNTEFRVQLIGLGSGGVETRIGVLGLNPNTEWRKIYVNLTRVRNNHPQFNNFYISFNFRRDPNIEVQEVLIDNLKLVF